MSDIFDVELGSLKAERQLSPILTDHDKEIVRLAKLLHYHRHEDLTIRSCVAITYDIINNYKPRIVWGERDNETMISDLDPIKIITVETTIGSRNFKIKRRLYEGESLNVVESFKRTLLGRLAHEIAEWMNKSE